jgi:Xaa-Pro dipeptidase
VTEPIAHLAQGFSSAEMLGRRRKLNDVLRSADLEHVVVYGANRSGSAVQWLTGWPVTREAVVVHSADATGTLADAPDTLLVHFYNHVPQARRLAPDSDVRWAGTTADTLVDELRTRGATAATRVGVIGALPFQAYRQLDAAVGEVVDLNSAYTALRLAKSAEELELLREAAALTDASCLALQEGARPGMTEFELGELVESSYLGQGGTNYIHYFSITSMEHPTQCVPSQWPTDRRLAVGDVLTCELSTSVGLDYPGQLLRTFTVGAEATPDVMELHAVADEALHRIERLLAPGVAPAEVVEAASVIEENGYTTVDDLVHGLGGGYLPPVFGSRSRTLSPMPDLRFAAGMTVVVQPNVTTPNGRLGVQTGELLHVTATGCERLHRFPRGMGRIA